MHGASVVGAASDTTSMTEDTWNTRDLPVLHAVVDIYEDSGTYLTRATAIERRTGLDHVDEREMGYRRRSAGSCDAGICVELHFVARWCR